MKAETVIYRDNSNFVNSLDRERLLKTLPGYNKIYLLVIALVIRHNDINYFIKVRPGYAGLLMGQPFALYKKDDITSDNIEELYSDIRNSFVIIDITGTELELTCMKDEV